MRFASAAAICLGLLIAQFAWQSRAGEPGNSPDPAAADLNEEIRAADAALAEAFLRRGTLRARKGDLDAALADVEESLRLNAKSADAYEWRGYLRESKGNLDGAIEDYTAALALKPDNWDALCRRGAAWHEKDEFDKALEDFDAAIRLNPNDADLFYRRGSVWAFKDNLEKAIEDYTAALQIDPAALDARKERAKLWREQGDFDRALADVNEALQRERSAEVLCMRGVVRALKGEFEKAKQDFAEALRLEPENAAPHAAQAWFWATAANPEYRDGRRAVESATRACELSKWNEALYISALAAACAEAGNFADAVKWQTKVIENLGAEKGAQRDLKKARERLELYSSGKPSRIELK